MSYQAPTNVGMFSDLLLDNDFTGENGFLMDLEQQANTTFMPANFLDPIGQWNEANEYPDQPQAYDAVETSLDFRVNVAQDPEAQYDNVFSEFNLPETFEPEVNLYPGLTLPSVQEPSEQYTSQQTDVGSTPAKWEYAFDNLAQEPAATQDMFWFESTQQQQQQSQGMFQDEQDSLFPGMPLDQDPDFVAMQETAAISAEQTQMVQMQAAQQQYAQQQQQIQAQGQAQGQAVQDTLPDYLVEDVDDIWANYVPFDQALTVPVETAGASLYAGLDNSLRYQQEPIQVQDHQGDLAAPQQAILPKTRRGQNNGQARRRVARPSRPVLAPQVAPRGNPSERVRKSKNAKWLEQFNKHDSGKPLKNESRPGMATGYKRETYAEKRQRCRGEGCNQTRQYCQCETFVV